MDNKMKSFLNDLADLLDKYDADLSPLEETSGYSSMAVGLDIDILKSQYNFEARGLYLNAEDFRRMARAN